MAAGRKYPNIKAKPAGLRRAPKARLSREEEADQALNHTVSSAGTRQVLIILFVVAIFLVPLTQSLVELGGSSHELTTLGLFGSLIPDLRKANNLAGLFTLIPSAQSIKATEKKIDDCSVLSRWALPSIQAALTGWFQTGNKEAYVASSGWLFYRQDVEYLTGPPFLDAGRLEQRRRDSSIQPDPILAILQFKAELAKRNIELLVLPVPVKPCVEGNRLSSFVPVTESLQNPSFAEFKTRLKTAGVQLLDLTSQFMAVKSDGKKASLYLETDTHWRPEIMDLAVRQVAAALNGLASAEPLPLQISEKQVTSLGDIFALLRLPPNQTLYHPETITIGTVSKGNTLWRSDQNADVLVLGDSFCNIYSLEQMGWGESAGFVEHLSRALGGRPVDCILRNSDGAFATREILSHELARGNDRLLGKKVVIWEFASRELAFGNWKLLDMELGQPAPSQFLALKPGQETIVTGVVQAASAVPVPGSIPYKDHIAAIELEELSGNDAVVAGSTRALVYLWSMRDNVWTRAARLRVGDRIKVHLFSWDDYSAQYDKFNRSELEDATVQLQEPTWGELIE